MSLTYRYSTVYKLHLVKSMWCSNIKTMCLYMLAIAIALLQFNACFVDNTIYNGIYEAKYVYFCVGLTVIIMLSIFIFPYGVLYSLPLNRIDLSLLALYILAFIGLFVRNHQYLIRNEFICLSYLLVYYFFIKHIYFWLEGKGRKICVNIILSGMLLSNIYQSIYGLLQLYDVLPSLNGYFEITGPFHNPAPYSFYVSALTIFSLGILLYIQPEDKFSYFIKYLAFSSLILGLIILPVTGNRASYTALIVGVIVLLFYKYDINLVARRIFNNKVKKFIAVSICVIVFSIISYLTYNLKPDSANGRLFIWKLAIEMISNKPIYGYGYSLFPVEYNKYQSKWFQINGGNSEQIRLADYVNYPYNEVLHILFEFGLIGILFGLKIVFSLFKFLNSTTKNLQTCNNVIMGSALCTVLVVGIFSYPFSSLPTAINAATFLAIISSTFGKRICVIDNTKPFGRHGRNRIFIPVISIFLVTVLGFISLRYQLKRYKAHETWRYATFLRDVAQDYKGASEHYCKIYSNLKYNGEFLRDYGVALSLERKYLLSNRILNKSKMLISDPIVYLKLSENFIATKQYKEAREILIFVDNMIPNRIYPKYLLTKIFVQEGEKEKAIELRNKILNMDIKVRSPFVKKIKREVKTMSL